MQCVEDIVRSTEIAGRARYGFASPEQLEAEYRWAVAMDEHGDTGMGHDGTIFAIENLGGGLHAKLTGLGTGTVHKLRRDMGTA